MNTKTEPTNPDLRDARFADLHDLASLCWGGACNVLAIAQRFAQATNGLSQPDVRDHPATPIVLGQLSFLVGEGIGPSPQAIARWLAYGEAGVVAEQAGAAMPCPSVASQLRASPIYALGYNNPDEPTRASGGAIL